MRCYASDPEYVELDQLAGMIATASNPHLCWQGRPEEIDMQAPELAALRQTLADQMTRAIERAEVGLLRTMWGDGGSDETE
jgi:hypothetical protein